MEKEAMRVKVADYVRRGKAKLGDPYMSDREFAEQLGYSTSAVSNARYGNMSDLMALKVAEVLGIEAGELLQVARAEREKDPAVKRALLDWAWRKRSAPNHHRARPLAALTA
jgi:transcriptional regulator with XRE-family HTH domain